MTAQAALKQIADEAQAIVDRWHANSRNFERELRRGTPVSVRLARIILKNAKQVA